MNRALFLDRDGVINIEKNYLYKIEDFEFMDGIFELCLYYQSLGYKIFIVTNQSGIARGYYTKVDFDILTDWMTRKFQEHNVFIQKVYYCPHHEKITGHCECRKPKPGMFLEAKKEFNIDLENSIMVGDNERDIESAINAGLKEFYLFDKFNEYKISKATKIVKKLDNIWKR